MKIRVIVTLKDGVLDPQGQAIEGAVSSLGFVGVSDVRQGKIFDFNIDETDHDKAGQTVRRMCESLLANTVIEKFTIKY